MNKVVVIGGSGRVGKYVIREIVGHYDVINADLVDDGTVQHIQTDVMDLDSVRNAVAGADTVLHLAAIDFDWNAAPEKYIDVNVRGSWHVLQACSESGVKKVVLCSSVSACGISEMRDNWRPQYLQIDEAHPEKPVQAYSVSKILMERMGGSFVDGTDMSVICLRPLAVVMQESFADFVNFIDNPDTHWLYYYVTAMDVAKAFRASIDVKELKSGVYYLSASDTCRAENTLDWYSQRIGALPELKNPRIYQQQPRASIFSSQLAKEHLSWQPSSNFMDLRKDWLDFK